jgi:Flp pilus assembly protein TadG
VTRRPEHGQALVEFSLAITVFLVLVMGVIDLGRLVYQYNGVAEAARAIARETSVHPGAPLGSSTQTAAVVATQRRLVPGLGTAAYACVTLGGSSVTGTCQPGNWVTVTVSSTFTPVTPLAAMLGTITVNAASSAKIE